MDMTRPRAAFDEQVRRHPEPDVPNTIVERGHGNHATTLAAALARRPSAVRAPPTP
jgi:hypothetical protein